MGEGPTPGRRRIARALLRRWWIRLAPRHFLRNASPTRAELGLAGEELAARCLLRRGWRLRGRRVATPGGEVDLWAERGGEGWVIEVKTGRLERLPRIRGHPSLPRWDLRWDPAGRLRRAQRRRLFRAAGYLERDRGGGRVAVVEVRVDRRGAVVEVLAPRVLAPEHRKSPGIFPGGRHPLPPRRFRT